MPSTAAEQEAERRYPFTEPGDIDGPRSFKREGFVAGYNRALEPYRELLEAAEAYRDARSKWRDAEEAWSLRRTRESDLAMQEAREGCYVAERRLLAAAAALNEEGGEPV